MIVSAKRPHVRRWAYYRARTLEKRKLKCDIHSTTSGDRPVGNRFQPETYTHTQKGLDRISVDSVLQNGIEFPSRSHRRSAANELMWFGFSMYEAQPHERKRRPVRRPCAAVVPEGWVNECQMIVLASRRWSGFCWFTT